MRACVNVLDAEGYENVSTFGESTREIAVALEKERRQAGSNCNLEGPAALVLGTTLADHCDDSVGAYVCTPHTRTRAHTHMHTRTHTHTPLMIE